jgi:phage tail sheath protein FI
MAELLSPKITVEELEPKLRNIVGVPTSVIGFVGIAERGPVGVATLVTSPEDYTAQFGGYTANADMTVAVQEAFRLGAKTLYIVRTVHYTDPSNAGTKTSAAGTLTLVTGNLAASSGTVLGTASAPFNLDHNDTLLISVNGAGAVTVTFTATAASRTSQNSAPFALANADTLTLKVDQGAVQTVTFSTSQFVSIGAATAAEVAAVINGQITGASATVSGSAVVITSDRKGTGSKIEITGGTANAAGKLNYLTAEVSGTGDASNIDAITIAEIKTKVEATVAGTTVTDVGGKVQIKSNTTGSGSSIQVTASSTADDELGLDNATHTGQDSGTQNTLTVSGKTDGAYANSLRVKVEAATSGVSGEFNLIVLNSSSQELERFPNLSMVTTATNYCVTVVNHEDTGSDLIALTDLAAVAPAPDDSPASGTFGPLTGGSDGLSSLADNDFIGAAAGSTGLYALNPVTSLTLLGVPARSRVAGVANSMITYVEVARQKTVFAVLDCPSGQSISAMKTYAGTVSVSEFVALYYPRVKILNPAKAIYGNASTITIPPSGPVLGVYARTDAARTGGVYDAPAGLDNGGLPGILGLESEDINQEANYDILYPLNVNGIRRYEGVSGFFIDGVRTMKRTGLFPTISERRGAMFIERSIANGLLFAKFKPHTKALRDRVVRTVTQFLTIQMQLGAFASTIPEEAFFVECDESLNTPDVIFANQLIVRIGLAMAKPCEFIRLQFTADTRALDAARAAA